MSSWILGSEMAASLGLRDFEFAREYVGKGFQPHNAQGQPYIPTAVVTQFIQDREQELAQHDDTAWNLFGNDRDKIIANHIEPLQRRIHGHRLYLESLNGTGWNGFVLPQDQELAAHFIRILQNSLFLKADVEKVFPAPAKPVMAVPLQAPVKAKKLRPQQRHKRACRAAAEKIWVESPDMTIEDMIQRDEIANACEGILYREKTIRNWIKDLCPNRKPGRRKEKSS